MAAGAFGKNASKGVAAPKDPCERRKTGRKSAYRNAKLVFGVDEMSCIAQDVSPKGCRIALEGAENLPDIVTLQLSLGSAFLRGTVVWRERNAAGIEFFQE